MAFRRMLPFILLNIIVSAAVVFGILWWWDGRSEEAAMVVQETAVAALAPDAPAATAAAILAVTQPEPTAEIAPEPTMPVHVVRSGETLMSISQFYDVPMGDIVTMNSLANPNILAVGQELLIPVGGIPTPTPPPTVPPPPTTVPTPNPTVPPDTEGEVVLRITGVFGVGNLTEEAVQIVNDGSRQAGLRGWTLRDEDGFVYTFGLVTIFGSGSGVVVHTEAGTDSATDLYWGLEQPIWRTGERVTLLDAEGTIRATYVIP